MCGYIAEKFYCAMAPPDGGVGLEKKTNTTPDYCSVYEHARGPERSHSD